MDVDFDRKTAYILPVEKQPYWNSKHYSWLRQSAQLESSCVHCRGSGLAPEEGKEHECLSTTIVENAHGDRQGDVEWNLTFPTASYAPRTVEPVVAVLGMKHCAGSKLSIRLSQKHRPLYFDMLS
jgi:hypothetical protein